MRTEKSSDESLSIRINYSDGERDVLPRNARPLHYDLSLEPNVDAATFQGTVDIKIEILETTDKVVMYSSGLNLLRTQVTVDGIDISSRIVSDPDAQRITIAVDRLLAPLTFVTVHHEFSGVLNDRIGGFYRSAFRTKTGETKYLAAAQLPPMDARRVFPCFDEPALKATFAVTLITPDGNDVTCLGNLDVLQRTPLHGGRIATLFRTTPPMSTYLLEFVVGELKCWELSKNDPDAFRVPVRVFCTPDQDIRHGAFAARLAARTLTLYEDEFDCAFPLPKMDMVALPDSIGALENWGLITYRADDVLLDEEQASAAAKFQVAIVVQHELAHQWFGNIVTMSFWDSLWLNEGFATWVSNLSCHRFFPEWCVWEHFVINDLQKGLEVDALASSHSIEVPVDRESDVNQVFDAITYSKGSCIVRMISSHLGEDIFMKGIRLYLQRHKYGNATTRMLWQSLGEVSDQDVAAFAGAWVNRPGFPVLFVTENELERSITVRQQRFTPRRDTDPEGDDRAPIWQVPLGLRLQGSDHLSPILKDRQDSIALVDMEFFKVNADHIGFYRTCYTPTRLQKLARQASLMTVKDRAGLVADTGALTAAGYYKTQSLLNLMEQFRTDQNYFVWHQILSRLTAVKGAWIFEDEKVTSGLRRFQSHLVSDLSHQLGWQFRADDSLVERRFKALLFSSASSAGDEACRAAAVGLFARFAGGDRAVLPSDLRPSVFRTAVQGSHGTTDEQTTTAYEFLLHEHATAPTTAERKMALNALGKATRPDLQERTLAYALSSSVRAQEVVFALGGLSGQISGVETRWTWFQSNWEALRRKVPTKFGQLGSVVRVVVGDFTKESQWAEVEAFFRDKNTAGVDRVLRSTGDSVRTKAEWTRRDAESVRAWLEDEGYL